MPPRSGLTFVVAVVLPCIFAVAFGQFPSPPPAPRRPVPCDELTEYSQTYSDCNVFPNCSGTRCLLGQFLAGSTAKFWVEETCADPVVVNLNLNVNGSGNSPLNGYRGRFKVGGGGLHEAGPNSLTADYGRNASHLTFKAMAIVEGDIATRLIPEITIPLHPRQCMCQSMRQIANAVRVPTQVPLFNIDVICSPRPDCVGVSCNVTFGSIGNYVTDVTIDPCGETVRMVVKDSSNVTQLDRTYRDSGSYSFVAPGGLNVRGTLVIGMVHHNYSMDLSVSLKTSLLPVEDILPSHKIILDRSHCKSLTYYYDNVTAPSTTIIPPVTTTNSPPPSNCLQTSAQNCKISTNCSGLTCTMRQQSGASGPLVAAAQIQERCADPVMVNMSVGSGYQRLFSVPGDGWGSDEVINGESVRVEYGRNPSKLHFKASPLIPDVHIPLYPRRCMCQSMEDIAKNIHFSSNSTLALISPSCSKRADCDGVRCVANNVFMFDVIVDPCQESVLIVITNLNNGSSFNHSLPSSGHFPLPLPDPRLSAELYVGIEKHNFSMKLSMHVKIPGDSVVLLSPRKIILDRSSCPEPITYYYTPEVTTQPSVTPSSSDGGGGGGGGGSQPSPTPSKHGSSLALVVGVPFGILMVVAIGLLVAIVTVLVLWRLRKRRRAYTFQRMAFNEIDDEDE